MENRAMTETVDLTMRESYVAVTPEVKEQHIWFLILGIALVALGGAAIAFPFIATLAMELLLGWILVLGGVVEIIQAFRTAKWKGFLFTLLGGLLTLGVGIILLIYPLTGILSLTLLIAAFFIVSGALRSVLAFKLRPLDQWGWLLFSGIVALVLGVLILAQWPEVAGWVVGVLVGIDLIFAGWTSIMLALAARRLI
jgi:uncharacterized membrane protein HdeD (DUF308 family)